MPAASTATARSEGPQAGLAFLQSALNHIEPKVYDHVFPQIQYPTLVPVVTTAEPWSANVIHYSRTLTGQAKPVSTRSTDFPLVSAERQQHIIPVEMRGIACDWTMEEMERAMMVRQRVANRSLPDQRMFDARFVAEREIERLCKVGDTTLQWDGLLYADRAMDGMNPKDGRPTVVEASGSGTDRFWTAKTAEQILADVNETLFNEVYIGSTTVEMPDVLGLPPSVFATLNSRFVYGTSMTLAESIRVNNIMTATTGKPLMLIGIRGLEASGSEDPANPGRYHGRAIAYRRDPSVLRLHVPMPFQFLPLEKEGPMHWVKPGIFRCGGLELRRPRALAYMDFVAAPVERDPEFAR